MKRWVWLIATALLCASCVLFSFIQHRQAIRRDDAAWAEAEQMAFEQQQRDLEEARQAFAQRLQGSWTQAVPEDRNSRLELSIADGTMDYNFQNVRFPEYDQTLCSYSWSAFDYESIEIAFPEGGIDLILVTFTPADGDTPEKVTFSPAFTFMGEEETWERSAP